MRIYQGIQYLIFLFISISFCALISCRNNQAKSLSGIAGNISEHSKNGQKLTIPDELQAYSPFKNYLLDSNQLAQLPSSKIYAYVNVSCSSCIGDIEKWNELIPVFMQNNVPVMLIFYTKDNFEYIKYLCESGGVKKFPFPFYLDTKNKFSEQNPIFKEYEMKPVVLVDKNNTIICSGNPLYSEKVKDLYMKQIKKF
ncbi:MAG: hypothetical protein Q8L07_01555 [Sediminibacterium sp.]|nr:hypothetical protein [Sediminibacterium sp.]MDP1811214.1 hypothetical protein [Sediminibacterium sp.]MDP3128715.1 hypothetical protein [Sediminibacterium sp.]